MENNEAQTCRYTDESIKSKYVAKLLHPFKTSGFQHIRMDDIAKYMDLSKATLYKYFPSRDEIIERLSEIFITYVIKAEEQLPEGSQMYMQGFQSSFAQSLIIANYGTEAFYQDMREVYPELMSRIDIAVSQRNERLQQFYERGMEEGSFNRLNATLLILQDDLMFRNLLDPVYLMKNNLTLRNAIHDYYQIKKLLLFSPALYASTDDVKMLEKIEYLVRKVSYGA
ncbi:TetR family transcriptional regulator [Paenibacillus baekrokdamisoli]|uniref:TetR family transcriptional regulator n=1 Tax=Paenibacillus baekrokdamisoli TaxID=1712516 RepID=A0A3G9IZM1_9BACL|nr:TetR/AcrR family transcriptional regulator [Paenibacillus baekrokdamisoli]MBB3067746.1 AcrR family transcriptional regulator [Paenibacillus baekrokdamisoli]BBH19071.1 TetR family transcriptional regulator [Paenibacillus baekrokdamisoli]